jgi:hypothetical protein
LALFSDDVGLDVCIAHHHLVDKVHDCRGGLFGFEFGEHVALVVGFVGRFASDESKASAAILNDSVALNPCHSRAYLSKP